MFSEPFTDPLIIANRAKLRKAFSAHYPNKQGKITISELMKFCKNVKIFPDLVSVIDLKKLLHSADFSGGIDYHKFQHLLKLLAKHSFNTKVSISDKLRMLFIHIRNAFKIQYHGILYFHSRNPSAKPVQNALKASYKAVNIRTSSQSPFKTTESPLTHITAAPSPYTESSQGQTKQISPFSKTFSSQDQKKIISPVASYMKKIASKVEIKKSILSSHLRTQSGGSLDMLKAVKALNKEKIQRENRENSSPIPEKILELTKTFSKFKETHTNLIGKGPKVVKSQVRVQKQQRYIQKVRNSMFGGSFVMSILFSAWKAVVKKSVNQNDLLKVLFVGKSTNFEKNCLIL